MVSAVALLVKSLEEAKLLSKGTYAAKLRRHLRYTKKDVLPTRWILLHRLLFLVDGKQPPKPPAHRTRLKLIKGGKR
jgi:hypothetical protein